MTASSGGLAIAAEQAPPLELYQLSSWSGSLQSQLAQGLGHSPREASSTAPSDESTGSPG